MGLDCSHGAWHGAYSAFETWREKLAEVAGIPLLLMEGFYDDLTKISPFLMEWLHEEQGEHGRMIVRRLEQQQRYLPIKWEILADDPLLVLLNHSDCEGEIAQEHLLPLAQRLRQIAEQLPDEDAGGHIGNWREKTLTFAQGCEYAAVVNEPLLFR